MYMKKGWLIKMGSSEKVILVKHLFTLIVNLVKNRAGSGDVLF